MEARQADASSWQWNRHKPDSSASPFTSTRIEAYSKALHWRPSQMAGNLLEPHLGAWKAREKESLVCSLSQDGKAPQSPWAPRMVTMKDSQSC